MHRSDLAAGAVAVGVQRLADGVQRFLLLAAHLLGQESQLALVRNMRGDALGFQDMRQQRFGNRQLGQLSGGQRHQLFAQRQHPSASRRCWLRLGLRNSLVSSSRPRIDASVFH